MDLSAQTKQRPAQPAVSVNWRQVAVFLAMTFVLTWGVNLAMYLFVDSEAIASRLVLLQFQMLLPAFSAILLSLFFFKNSPISLRGDRRLPRNMIWFCFFFLAYTGIYLVLVLWGLVVPEQAILASSIAGFINMFGLLVLIALRGFGSAESFAAARLGGGKLRDWILYGMAFILFYALQTLLNAAFHLGTAVDIDALIQALSPSQAAGPSANVFLALVTVQTLVIGPLVGLLLAFGEEYGWRGYLQSELLGLGKKRAVLLVGLIWGVWHYPVILMGFNYPGYPLPGLVLMTIFTVLLSVVLGYVMLRTGSIWLVAFLHALNNQAAAFFYNLFYQPASPVFSFGIGLYGLITLALIVILLLRDPIWRD